MEDLGTDQVLTTDQRDFSIYRIAGRKTFKLQRGDLEIVLPEWELPALNIHAVMPERHYVPPKVRAFIDFMDACWSAQRGWTSPRGFFLQPAVFANTKPEMTIVREEIFGPVVAASSFDSIEQIVPLANATSYGLGASVWTNNLTLVHRLIPKIKAGTIWVNSHNLLDPAVPFGGLRASGYGRELGHAAVDLYTETKSVTIAI